MRNHGGFEANGQTFRIVTKLEPYTKNHGMDLTRRTILGLIKYPQLMKPTDSDISNRTNSYIKAAIWKPVKGLFMDDEDRFEWILRPMDKDDRTLFCSTEELEQTNGYFNQTKTKYKSFDASIMELADDIAYGVHDLEDAIVLGRVNERQWQNDVLPDLLAIDNAWANKHGEQLSEMLFSSEHFERKNAIGALVNHLITSVVLRQNIGFKSPLLKHNASLNNGAAPLLESLKRFVFKHVIKEPELQRLEFSGQNSLIQMFEAFSCDAQRLLPTEIFQQYETSDSHPRVICDFLANMSDNHAKRLHKQLFT